MNRLWILLLVVFGSAQAEFWPLRADNTAPVVEFALYHDTTGQNLSGLTFETSGLAFACKLSNDATYTTFTKETITTISTYAAPTSAAHVRIAEIQSTGTYQAQFHVDFINDVDSKWIKCKISGADDLLDANLTFWQDTANIEEAAATVLAEILASPTPLPSDTLSFESNPAAERLDLLATQAKQDTAQTDLDTITDDGVILATSQPNYAPATAEALTALTDPPGEPTGVFSWTTATIPELIAYMAAFQRNEINQTATTKTLRNDADDADLVECAVSDDGTTFTRSKCADPD